MSVFVSAVLKTKHFPGHSGTGEKQTNDSGFKPIKTQNVHRPRARKHNK